MALRDQAVCVAATPTTHVKASSISVTTRSQQSPECLVIDAATMCHSSAPVTANTIPAQPCFTQEEDEECLGSTFWEPF